MKSEKAIQKEIKRLKYKETHEKSECKKIQYRVMINALEWVLGW